MGQRVFLKEYDFNLTAGGVAIVLAEAEYFRIQASSGAVSIMIDGLGELPNLQAGQGIKSTPFKRLTIRDVSGAANVGRILVSNQEFIDNRTYGVNSLDAATVNSLKLTTPRPESTTGFYNVSSVVAANTAEQIFSPAANVSGAIVQQLMFTDLTPGFQVFAYLAKTAAPVNINDGEVIHSFGANNYNGVAAYLYNSAMPAPQLVAPGKGLYFIGNLATTAQGQRACRYKLL